MVFKIVFTRYGRIVVVVVVVDENSCGGDNGCTTTRRRLLLQYYIVENVTAAIADEQCVIEKGLGGDVTGRRV